MLKDTEKESRKPKQAAVMQAATGLFVRHGYDGASTEMIAERAGVSRQTIYNRFESKEALFLAIAKNLVHEVGHPRGCGQPSLPDGAGDTRAHPRSSRRNGKAEGARP